MPDNFGSSRKCQKSSISMVTFILMSFISTKSKHQVHNNNIHTRIRLIGETNNQTILK